MDTLPTFEAWNVFAIIICITKYNANSLFIVVDIY
jgi:hypothetical protein